MQDNLFPNSEPQKKRRARKTDDVHEAMLVVFWPSGISDLKGERARVGRLVEMARARLPDNIHKTGAIAMLRERVALYKKHKSFRDCAATPDAVLTHWDDVAQSVDATLRELCKEWLGTIRQDAALFSSSLDDTDRLAAWLLFQEEAGELKAKRPELADAAAAMLERLRCKYTYSTGRPIRRAVQELRELT